MITAEGLQQLGFTLEVDFSLQNDGDGNYIRSWMSASPQPSESAIETAHAEWQAEHDSTQYQRDRAAAYASLGDQMDMQYWDAFNGTTTWPDHVKEIKKRFPK